MRFGGRRCALGRCRECVDNLTGARIVQLFTGLMFDRSGIVLKLVDVLAKVAVLLLQTLHLDLQLARLFAFVGEGSKSVVPEDDAVSHHHREHTCTEGRHLAA